ncbi:MAG: glycoside hydrolase [Candidatus Hydrogenedentes bacterium]|nr:glycoside hydrolase [Candidatus Hydrogenedentota bacterium]
MGPEFELCCPITVLPDGRWIWPTSTWFDWAGNCPSGLRMIAWISEDEGKTWPTYMDVMHEDGNGAFFWESKIVALNDGRLLAVAWAYDNEKKADRENQYTLSSDSGKTWTPLASTGLQGQTLTPILLEDGRILSVYRRMDQPGLWANLSHLEGDTWVNSGATPIWGQQAAKLTGETDNMSDNFAVLRFGAPPLTRRDDGTVYGAFWGYEDCVSVLRWFTMLVP